MKFHRHARAIAALGISASIALLASGAWAQTCAVYTLDKDGNLREACGKEAPQPKTAPRPRPKPKPKATAPSETKSAPGRALSEQNKGQSSAQSGGQTGAQATGQASAQPSAQVSAPPSALPRGPTSEPTSQQSSGLQQAEPASPAAPAADRAVEPRRVEAAADPGTGDWLASIALGALVAVLTWFALRFALPATKRRDEQAEGHASATEPQAATASKGASEGG